MKCPKCKATMEQADLDDFEIDYCPECRGLWFQPGELDELKFDSFRAPAVLDHGSTRRGRKFNDVIAPCPQCGKTMTHERDEEQAHILMDYCPDGHGIFLDAGEFTDLARKTIWDKFKIIRR